MFCCDLNLYLPNDLWCWAPFYVLVTWIFLVKCLLKDSSHFKIELFFLHWVLRIQTLSICWWALGGSIVISLWFLTCISLVVNEAQHFLQRFIGLLDYLFGQVPIHVLRPFFSIGSSPFYWFVWACCMLWIWVLYLSANISSTLACLLVIFMVPFFFLI